MTNCLINEQRSTQSFIILGNIWNFRDHPCLKQAQIGRTVSVLILAMGYIHELKKLWVPDKLVLSKRGIYENKKLSMPQPVNGYSARFSLSQFAG